MSNVSGSHWIRDEKRLRIYRRDGFTCWACLAACLPQRQLMAGEGGPQTRLATLGHVLARESGGSNHHSNLATECMHCNSSRRHQAAVPWAFANLGAEAAAALSRLIERVCSELPPKGPLQ